MNITLNQPKAPTKIDEYVGSRVRLRRKMLGFSQEALGVSVGVSFQQIQKYEKGTNRIGASRLVDIAACLDTPVSFFFQGADVSYVPSEETTPGHNGAKLNSTREGVELAAIFAEIENPSLRENILSLVRVLVEQHHAEKTWLGNNPRTVSASSTSVSV